MVIWGEIFYSRSNPCSISWAERINSIRIVRIFLVWQHEVFMDNVVLISSNIFAIKLIELKSRPRDIELLLCGYETSIYLNPCLSILRALILEDSLKIFHRNQFD